VTAYGEEAGYEKFAIPEVKSFRAFCFRSKSMPSKIDSCLGAMYGCVCKDLKGSGKREYERYKMVKPIDLVEGLRPPHGAGEETFIYLVRAGRERSQTWLRRRF
jgi:hypothetical protein